MEKNCKYEEEELLEKEFQSQVMNMKQKYGEIPVPAHARDRMLAGIRQAKEEKERSVSRVISLEDRKGRKNMKNHVWMKRTAVAAAAVLVTVGALANISPVTANAMEKLPIIGTLAKVMTFRTFEDEQGNFNSKIDIPKIDSENGTEIAANQEIEEYAESLIAQYEKDLESSGGEGHYSMESSYDIVSQNDRYVSIRINTTLVMASGTQYVKVFTIDKTTGNTVSLTDLTGGSGEMLTKISENIKEQMRAQMKEDENIAYFIDSDIPEMDFAGLTGTELVYDLYTGTGTIANFVAGKARKVIGIEYVPEAIEDAKINSQINGIGNTLFFAGDMKDILNKEFITAHGQPDVIITDPPRAGMHKDVIETILFAAPHRIVYVSCNPATQARDLALLDSQYKIMGVRPVDMFPHTQHVENVVMLERRA